MGGLAGLASDVMGAAVNEWVVAGTLARVHRVCPFFREGHLQCPVTLMLDIASEEEKGPAGADRPTLRREDARGGGYG